MHDHVVAGDPEPDSPAASVTRTAAETRLPWHVRALASTDSERATAGQTRRNSILAALALIGFLIPTTGYLVLRAVNQELALARQQAAFVAGVSHEFRSPLTALSHLTALLRSDFKPSDERRLEYYDALARETERLRGFVETVLDVGRIQAGAARYRPTNVDLGTLVAYVVEEFGRRAAGEHAVSCIVSGAAVVSVDDQALQRAMWNLLDNAAKYSAPKRPIAVRLDCEGDRAIIRIADEGPGIPEAEQPFVFDQFFRGAAAIESAVRGTGIGLSLVRHIVEAHGGTVGVESTSRAGSTFRIELPAAASRDDARRAS
jgi:signal transduction histidine kinase